MKRTFSDFVRSLGPDGEPPDDALDAVWTELRRLLRRVLQRRGLWDRPPSYLGVLGHPAWTTPESAGAKGVPSRTRDALDELTADCYVEIFVQRLAALARYVERGDDVEGVVRLAAGQLIQDRQQGADPLGYRLYQWLRAALERGVQERRLHVAGEGATIHNGTVLTFEARSRAAPAGADALAAAVGRWNDDLLLDWVAGGKRAAASIERLERRVVGLRAAGVEAFDFKDLADAFKRDVRSRLAALLGDPDEPVRDDPLRPREQRQWLRDVSRCVEAGIEAGGDPPLKRRQLLELWRFLEAFARAAVDPETGSAGDALAAALQAERLPSNRGLARLLGIHRERFPALFARLRQEAARCLQALDTSRPPLHATSGAAANADTLEGSAASGGSEATLDTPQDLRQQLKRRTAEAWREARAATPGSPESAGAPEAPEAGGLYHLEGCPEPGVEWLALEIDPAGDVLAVPADSLPAAGSADVAIDAGSLGPLTVRAGLGVHLGGDVLAGRRAGALAAADLERVRVRRRRLRAGDLGDDEAAHEVDADPDYRARRRALETARNAVARVYGGRIDEPAVASSDSARPVEMTDVDTAAESTEKAYEKVRWLERRQTREILAVAASLLVAVGAVAGYRLLSNARAERDALARELEAAREPEMSMPWLLTPLSTRRGSPEVLTVPPGARSIGLLVDAENGDRIEIRDAAGDEVWSGTVEGRDTPDEVLVRLPARLMPPSEYRVRVWRGETLDLDFQLLIENP